MVSDLESTLQVSDLIPSLSYERSWFLTDSIVGDPGPGLRGRSRDL